VFINISISRTDMSHQTITRSQPSQSKSSQSEFDNMNLQPYQKIARLEASVLFCQGDERSATRDIKEIIDAEIAKTRPDIPNLGTVSYGLRVMKRFGVPSHLLAEYTRRFNNSYGIPVNGAGLEADYQSAE
jgi:hypothetical protein